MTPLALMRMAQLGDSAFPSGGFAFSGGLEVLAAEGGLRTAGDVERVIAEQVLERWLDCDRWFLVETHRAAPDLDAVAGLDAMCGAQTLCAPLAEASRRMGRATLSTATRIGASATADYAARVRAGSAEGHLAVAQGLAAAGLDLPVAAAEAASAHALLAGALGAAVRLGRIGALGAQAALTRLGDRAAERLAAPPAPRAHAFAPLAEIAAARRDRLAVALFAA